MQVGAVERVEIERLAAAFADGAEAHLAQATDLVQHLRDRVGRREEHVEAALRGERAVEPGDLRGDGGGIGRGGDRFGSG